MARKARVYSDSLIYHTIIRGNNAEAIFKTMEDKKRIVDILYQKAENDNYEVFAYCILDDHAHFGTGRRIVHRRDHEAPYGKLCSVLQPQTHAIRSCVLRQIFKRNGRRKRTAFGDYKIFAATSVKNHKGCKSFFFAYASC